MAYYSPNSAPRPAGGWSPRDIRPGGCLIILAVLALLAWGGSRFLHSALRQAPATAGGGGSVASGGGAGGGGVVFSTTGTKAKWVKDESDKFNAQHADTPVTVKLTESRQAMQDILNGKLQPTLWSPSSPVWTDRLAARWAELHGGEKILDTADPAGYRVFFKSPLVFLTTQRGAARLRPLLTGPAPWEGVRRLALTHKVHFSYADPLNASSGALTMSLIITEYAREHGGLGDLAAVAASPGFTTFLKQLDTGLDRADTGGSSALEQAYQKAPQGRDFITAYESAGLQAVKAHPDLVLLYPSPTANADQGAAALTASWVTAPQRATAQAFLTFLASDAALADGAGYGFRPAGSNGAETLAGSLTGAARAQFHATYESVDLPPYAALNEAAAQWRSQR